MRMLKLLLTGLFALFALVAGLFIAVVGFCALMLGRLMGGSGRIRVRTQMRGQPQPTTSREPRDTRDVIDVTATEVPADSLHK